MTVADASEPSGKVDVVTVGRDVNGSPLCGRFYVKAVDRNRSGGASESSAHPSR